MRLRGTGSANRLACAAFAGMLCFPVYAHAAPSFLDPRGALAVETGHLFWIVILLMLIVVVPVLVLTPLIAWRYRSANPGAAYRPDWESSRPLEMLIWGVPVLIVALLAVLVWRETHRLDPYRPIASARPPLDVEVVALDWKWLFIYPDQHIATVNALVFPADRPLRLRLTSDTVMQSFMIPQLGGQIYAMAGMTTRLNLVAGRPGVFTGANMQFNGEGFQKQHFQVLAVSSPAFDRFVTKAGGAAPLDPARYKWLSARSTIDRPLLFSAAQPGLFDAIVARYQPGLTPGAGAR